MSYAVIHMQKIKMGGVKGVQNHTDRLKESHTNPDIDYSKSYLNKQLDPYSSEKTYYNRIRDRIKELDLPKAVRKDAVTMCGFICTSDKAFFEKLPQQEQDRYFKESFDFLKNRYGEKNLVGCTVHYDETTPHMHYYVVPVTKDGRLSAKDIFTPVELKQLQTDYHKHMTGKGFDLERGRSSDRRHMDVQTFKEQTGYYDRQKEELEKTALELKAKSQDLNAKKQEIHAQAEKIQDQEIKLDKFSKQIEQKKQEIEFKEKAILEKEKALEIKSFAEVNNIKTEKTFGGKIKISEDDFKRLDKAATDGLRYQDELQTLKPELEDYKKAVSKYANINLEKYELSSALRSTQIRLNQLERGINSLGLTETLEKEIKQSTKAIEIDLER